MDNASALCLTPGRTAGQRDIDLSAADLVSVEPMIPLSDTCRQTHDCDCARVVCPFEDILLHCSKI